jgi:hypothetical protein
MSVRIPVVGYLTQSPLNTWFSGYEPVQWVALHTVNQVLEALAANRVDYLAIEPEAAESLTWWATMLAAAERMGVTPVILLKAPALGAWQLKPWRPDTDRRWKDCVQLGVEPREVWHLGNRTVLPDRLFQLLHALVSRPDQLHTRETLNQDAEQWGWPAWSDEQLRAAIHRLRQLLGREHIQSVRPHSYRWVSCVRSPNGAEASCDPQTSCQPSS